MTPRADKVSESLSTSEAGTGVKRNLEGIKTAPLKPLDLQTDSEVGIISLNHYIYLVYPFIHPTRDNLEEWIRIQVTKGPYSNFLQL